MLIVRLHIIRYIKYQILLWKIKFAVPFVNMTIAWMNMFKYNHITFCHSKILSCAADLFNAGVNVEVHGSAREQELSLYRRIQIEYPVDITEYTSKLYEYNEILISYTHYKTHSKNNLLGLYKILLKYVMKSFIINFVNVRSSFIFELYIIHKYNKLREKKNRVEHFSLIHTDTLYYILIKAFHTKMLEVNSSTGMKINLPLYIFFFIREDNWKTGKTNQLFWVVFKLFITVLCSFFCWADRVLFI